MRLTKKEHKEKRALKKEKKRQRMKRDKVDIIDGIPVNKDKWGANDNTDNCIIPEYYYDINYDCLNCGLPYVWTAEQQQYFFEELGGNINSGAVYCKICRAHVQALKEDQQRHMAKMAEQKPHKNEAFFNKKF